MSEIPTEMISRLIPRYAEPHRRYHTWSHIGACFDAIERISSDRSQEVALALFYHDAIYEPLSKDNEKRSAELLMSEGERSGVDPGVLKKARGMIFATCHNVAPDAFRDTRRGETEQECLVVDADLSILGTDDTTFDRYEYAIRQEYAMVPDTAFAVGRAKVMDGFLRREHVFMTATARDLWERKARENIGRSLRRWSAGTSSS